MWLCAVFGHKFMATDWVGAVHCSKWCFRCGTPAGEPDSGSEAPKQEHHG